MKNVEDFTTDKEFNDFKKAIEQIANILNIPISNITAQGIQSVIDAISPILEDGIDEI